MDLKIDNGKVVAYRTRVQPSFKYDGLAVLQDRRRMRCPIDLTAA